MGFERVFNIFNWSLVKIDGRQTLDKTLVLLFGKSLFGTFEQLQYKVDARNGLEP